MKRKRDKFRRYEIAKAMIEVLDKAIIKAPKGEWFGTAGSIIDFCGHLSCKECKKYLDKSERICLSVAMGEIWHQIFNQDGDAFKCMCYLILLKGKYEKIMDEE